MPRDPPRLRRGSPAKLEIALHALDDGLEDLDARKILVLGLDHGPGRDLAAGAVYHVAYRLLVFAPFLAVAPVLLGDLEALEAGLLPQGEALELFLRRDLQPE